LFTHILNSNCLALLSTIKYLKFDFSYHGLVLESVSTFNLLKSRTYLVDLVSESVSTFNISSRYVIDFNILEFWLVLDFKGVSFQFLASLVRVDCRDFVFVILNCCCVRAI